MRKCSFLLVLLVMLLSGCKEKSAMDYSDEDYNKVIDKLEYLSFKDGEDISSAMDDQTLSLVANDSFLELSLRDQYSYIMEFYEDFRKINYMFSYLDIGLPENDHVTYSVDFLGGFKIESIDEIIMKDNDADLEELDKLDKKVVWNGTLNGKTAAEILAEEEKAKNEYKKESVTTPSTTTKVNASNNGHEWVSLNSSQKRAKISRIINNLTNNGYVILESESFFVSALDSFYTDSSTMSTEINQAFVMVSAMSGAVIAP